MGGEGNVPLRGIDDSLGTLLEGRLELITTVRSAS